MSREGSPREVTCVYCGLTARFLPYFYKCQLCDNVFCRRCGVDLKLHVVFKLEHETHNVTRCQGCLDSPLVITKKMVIDMYQRIMLGDYESDTSTSSYESSSSTSSDDPLTENSE